MRFLEDLFAEPMELATTLAVLVAVLLALWAANWLLLRRHRGLGEESRFPRRIAMVLIAGIGLVVILLDLPVGDETRGQLLSLLGLALTAVIALSSTTLVGNAMAGMVLRAVRSFRPGDFVRVGEQVGRVTERGLFHVEIQTEDRDLTTIPNLYMLSHPIAVVRASGTIVSASVSLGYENPHPKVETLLIRAAGEAGLQEPFVQVVELGDFSVTYRVAGFLPEVKQLLTARSNLRKAMLDTFHGRGIEIVSPAFMNQRPQPEGSLVVPPEVARPPVGAEVDTIPEELIFDKAEQAEKLEELRAERESLLAEAKALGESLARAGEADRPGLEAEIARRNRRVEAIAEILEAGEKDDDR